MKIGNIYLFKWNDRKYFFKFLGEEYYKGKSYVYPYDYISEPIGEWITVLDKNAIGRFSKGSPMEKLSIDLGTSKKIINILYGESNA